MKTILNLLGKLSMANFYLENWDPQWTGNNPDDLNAITLLLKQLRGQDAVLDLELLDEFFSFEGTLCVARLVAPWTIVGMASLSLRHGFDRRSAEIERVVVAEPLRGQGIGKAVVRSLIKTAQELKITKLRLGCDSDNEPLNRFYASLGFKLASEGENRWRMDFAS